MEAVCSDLNGFIHRLSLHIYIKYIISIALRPSSKYNPPPQSRLVQSLSIFSSYI